MSDKYLIDNKFFVIKYSDYEKLSMAMKIACERVLATVADEREQRGEKQNEYWVINKDEPYAEEVRKLIQGGSGGIIQ